MRILNLGCGARICPAAINIDWSFYLRLKQEKWGWALARSLLRVMRLADLKDLPKNIMIHDLSKGIPFPDNSIDVVYHSHLLEHLERHAAPRFLLEVKRVLKPGGVQRIVLPDFEKLCRDYIAHCDDGVEGIEECARHENYIAAVIEQCVRREAYETSQREGWRRRLENLFLGDARKRGETHQWMYDRTTITTLLREAGFRDIRVESYNSSRINEWDAIGLDLDANGKEYIPRSLYVECLA